MSLLVGHVSKVSVVSRLYSVSSPMNTFADLDRRAKRTGKLMQGKAFNTAIHSQARESKTHGASSLAKTLPKTKATRAVIMPAISEL